MQIVIVGAGFAGIKAALELSRRGFTSITLISDRSHFLNHASLHKLVSLEDESVATIEFDDLLVEHPSIKVVYDRLVSIEPGRRLVTCKRKKFYYDKLILALGTSTDLGAVKGVSQHGFDAESLKHLRRLRRHVLTSLNKPGSTDDVYTIVGGGAAGVELAGSLASFVNQLNHHPTTRTGKITIGLIEKQSRLLPNFSKTASKVAEKRLQSLGVNILTDQTVIKVDKSTVVFGDQKLPSNTTIWATGVVNNPFYQQHSEYFGFDRQGNVLVNAHLEAYRDIHVLGDNTNIHSISPVASALDMADYVADHLARLISGRQLRQFKAPRPLVTVPIGDDWAYAEYRRIYSSGRSGYRLHRWKSVANYNQIMTRSQALKTWNKYNSEPLD